MKRVRLEGDFMVVRTKDWRALMMEVERLRETERLGLIAQAKANVAMPVRNRAQEQAKTEDMASP